MPRKAKEKDEIKEVKKANTTKKVATKKNATNKTSSKKNTSKKASTKKVSDKKTTAKKTTKKTVEKTIINEYYDLPYKYNQTVVKLLYQTPKTLFIYWEISDSDIEKYKEQFGENFFETTKPVLIIHNDTLNYSFEVEINDFANSWYLHINDSKSNYRIELGRRPIQKNEKLNTDYIYISSSNEIESPNDHILFINSQKMAFFRNVKTGQEYSKSIANHSFIRNMGKIYDIYDLYKDLYKDEDIEDFSNPSSMSSSRS